MSVFIPIMVLASTVLQRNSMFSLTVKFDVEGILGLVIYKITNLQMKSLKFLNAFTSTVNVLHLVCMIYGRL